MNLHINIIHYYVLNKLSILKYINFLDTQISNNDYFLITAYYLNNDNGENKKADEKETTRTALKRKARYISGCIEPRNSFFQMAK